MSDRDSYALGDYVDKYTSCFSYFNNSIISNNNKNIDLKYSIILEKKKYSSYSKDDLNMFFSSIKQIGIIDFEEEYKDNGDLYLNLKYKKQNKAYLQYTGMVIRCLYAREADKFYIIAKHFINLCKYFENIDKGLLFTLSCNIFCFSDYSAYFNANHILMNKDGCKLLKTDEIIKILNTNTGINLNFSSSYCNNRKEKFTLENDLKESYLKLIERNGIK